MSSRPISRFTAAPSPRLLLALPVLGLLLASCSSNPDESLAALKPYGSESLESCGDTTHGVELRNLDDDIEDWTIEEATDELGPPLIASNVGDVKRAGWYDVTIGKANCGMLLEILERRERSIVTVRGLRGIEIWKVLGGEFPS